MADEEGSANNPSFSAGASTTDDSKWAKNGYGQGIAKVTGKFSKEESEIVRKAVEEFCGMKQISVSRLCSECDHKADLKGAWMEIAKRLPHRSVQSVYRHGLRQLHPFKRGAWTEEECETLVNLVHRMGHKWAAIQRKLNRSTDACRDKYREMNDSYVRGRWKEEETELLKRLIREHLKSDPNSDLKDLGKMVESEGIKIPWAIISKRMVNRSRLSCFKKWQKMTGLYSPSDQVKGTQSDIPPKAGDSEAQPAEAAKQNAAPQTLSSSKAPPVASHTPAQGPEWATTGGNPMGTTAEAGSDTSLLTELAALGVSRASEVDWDGIRQDNAQERWHELLEEFQATADNDDVMGLPLSGIAQLMLDRKSSAP